MLSFQERALERIVLPLSGLTSWLAVLTGVFMALHGNSDFPGVAHVFCMPRLPLMQQQILPIAQNAALYSEDMIVILASTPSQLWSAPMQTLACTAHCHRHRESAANIPCGPSNGQAGSISSHQTIPQAPIQQMHTTCELWVLSMQFLGSTSSPC